MWLARAESPSLRSFRVRGLIVASSRRGASLLLLSLALRASLTTRILPHPPACQPASTVNVQSQARRKRPVSPHPAPPQRCRRLPLPTPQVNRHCARLTSLTSRLAGPSRETAASHVRLFFDGTSRAATFGRQTASCAAPSFALNATGLAARWSYPASRSLGAFQSQTRLLLKLLPVIGICSRLQNKSQTPAISPASPPQQWLPL
jgi:hypothetical protein